MPTNPELINSVADNFASAGTNLNGSPDDAARAFELGSASGAPAQAISPDVKAFETIHRQQLGQQIINENSDIADFINAHPLHGQLVADDLGNLDTYSRALGRLNGRHAFKAGAEAFSKGFWGDNATLGSEYPNWIKDSDKYALGTSALAPIGIPAEILGRGFRGLLTGAHAAIKALHQDYGFSEQEATKAANDLAGMLEYELVKPENKFAIEKGKTQFEYPDEGDVLPPEPKKPSPEGLPSPGQTIEGQAIDLTQKIVKEAEAIRPFIEAGETPPPGVSEVVDKLHEESSKLSHDMTNDAFDAKGKTQLLERSPEKFDEFTSGLPDGTTRIQSDAFQKLGEAGLKPENLGWIEDLQKRLASQPYDITVPTNDFISKTPKEIYTEIKDFVAHGDDLTPDEIESLKSDRPQVIEAPPEDIDPAVLAVRRSASLEPKLIPEAEGDPKPWDRKPIFSKAKAFGRTEKEFSKYQALINQMDKEDLQWRLDRAQKQAQQQNSKDWKDEIDRIEPEVRAETENREEIQAYRFFQDGVAYGQRLKQRPKISRTELTTQQKEVFPDKFITDRKGYTPDAVANLFGFESGDDLIAAISSLENEASAGRGDIVDRLVKAEVNRRVSAKLGESAKERLDEVYDHVLSLTQMEQLHEQMLALGTRIGGSLPISPMATKLGALNLLHGEPFGGMSSRKYMNDSGRFGRKLEKALLAEDPLEAFKSAQAQYISASMAKEARQVEKERAGFLKEVKRFSKREVPGVDPEYTNWVHDILSRIGYDVRIRADLDTEINAQTDKTLQDFLNTKASMGREIYVPEFLLDPTFEKDLGKMSVLDARRTMQAVKSLARNGRDELKVKNQGKRLDLNDLLDQMLDQLEALGPAQQFPENGTAYQAIRKGMRTYLASSLQIESLMNRFDKGDAFGVFNQWVTRPLVEAANSEAALQKEISKDYLALPGHLTKEELAKPIPNKLFKDPLEAWQKDGSYDWRNAGYLPFTRKELRAVLLNVGNKSNLEKLARGYGIEPAQVMDFVNTYATERDWDWAQAHGNMFKKLKNLADIMYRELSGVAPENIPLEPIETLRHGTFDGWYHPVIYDGILEGQFQKPVATKALFGDEFTRANTPASYTKARTNFVGPLSLSLDQVPARLVQEIHDISFHAPVVEASKVIYHPRFLNGITKFYGKEYSQLFQPWLKDIANAKNYNSANQAAMDRWATYFRSNIIGTFIGLNPRTVEKHTLTALFNSIKEVGGADFRDAVASLFSDSGRGGSNWDFAMKTSEELQRRHQNFVEQVSGAQETTLEGRNFRQSMLKFGTTPVAMLDLASAVPTWLAAYKRNLESGKSHGDAVFAADYAVRRAHGSTAITSRPAVMRNYPGIASLYNFMNRMAQYQYELGWKARDLLTGKADGKEAQWTKDVMLGLFVNVLLVGLVDVAVSDLTDKDTYASTIAKSIATGVAAPWWGARDIMHAVLHKSDPMLGLGSTELKVVTDAIRDINSKDFGMSRNRLGKTVKHVNNMLGLATGLTNAEIGNLAEYIVDLNNGRAKPKTAGDWWRGITKGQIKQREPHPDLIEKGLRVITGGR